MQLQNMLSKAVRLQAIKHLWMPSLLVTKDKNLTACFVVNRVWRVGRQRQEAPCRVLDFTRRVGSQDLRLCTQQQQSTLPPSSKINVMATQLTCMEGFVLQASEHGMVGSSVYTVYELHSGDDTSGAGNCGAALACWESSLLGTLLTLLRGVLRRQCAVNRVPWHG